MTNLWANFCRDCPVLSKVPALRYYCFGHYARAYHERRADRCQQ